jgi:hypothetical protein
MLDSSKSAVTIEDVMKDMPAVHHGAGLYALEYSVICEIKRIVKPGMFSLETGSGLSTFLFLLCGAKHTVITPDGDEISRIRKYCNDKSISLEGFSSMIESSHTALTKQKSEYFDVILIDGCHGIPMVHVDYLFSALALKTGGVLIIDDVQLSSVKDLLDFLKQDASWRLDGVFGKTAFLTKLKSGNEIMEWDKQPYVLKNTYKDPQNWPITYHLLRLGRAAKMLFSGDFKSIKAKMAR